MRVRARVVPPPGAPELPLLLAIASISSMKMVEGASCRAISNRIRTCSSGHRGVFEHEVRKGKGISTVLCRYWVHVWVAMGARVGRLWVHG